MFRSSNGFRILLAMGLAIAAICVSSGPVYAAGVQVSLASSFTGDDVLRYSGGAFTTPNGTWDNPTGTNNNNWMVTQSAANQLATSQGLLSPAPVGINDNGLYPASGARLYDVQLGFTNTTPTGTNVSIRSNAAGNFSFNVPSNNYSQFAIFGSSGSGSSTLAITLNYSTGSPTVLSGVTLPDWYSGNPGTTAAGAAGTYFALTPAMSRQGGTGNGFPSSNYQVPNVSGNGAYIYGINLAPDSTRLLTSVQVAYTPSTVGYTVVNLLAAAGAVATSSSTPTVPTLSTWGLVLLAAGLSVVCWLLLRPQRKAF